MMVSRRQFLAGAGTLPLFLPHIGAGHGHCAEVETLRAAPGEMQLAPAGFPATPIWGYDGRSPGPTLHVREGQRLKRWFRNELPQASAIHWHGIRIENSMDGVPGLTQDLVKPGDTFLYDFAAPDAGTYWYHPHNRSWEQLARGLYGALIVEESSPP